MQKTCLYLFNKKNNKKWIIKKIYRLADDPLWGCETACRGRDLRRCRCSEQSGCITTRTRRFCCDRGCGKLVFLVAAHRSPWCRASSRRRRRRHVILRRLLQFIIMYLLQRVSCIFENVLTLKFWNIIISM